MPGLATLRRYQPGWLGNDLLAGIILTALLVPQGMAYADLAGLPPITGLYTTVACLVAYAVFGPSPRLVLGPDSSLGPIIAAAILPLAAGDEGRAVALAGALALMVGALCIGAGAAKLGFVADLLSKPVRIGYLGGLAITIVVGQVPKFLGFSVDADSFIGELQGIVRGLDQTNPWTLAVGSLTLAILVGLPRIAPRLPSILIAVVVAIGTTAFLGLAAHDVSTVGVLPQGFPRLALPVVGLSDLALLAVAAFGITMVAIGDTISTSASFAARQKLEIDPNQELVGIGAANIAAGLFSGFAISTSGSRTAAAEQAGSKSQLTGITAALLVLAMLLFVPGLFRNLPDAALAAILIFAGGSLLDVAAFARLFAIRRREFLVAVVCVGGVVFLGVLFGILVAIGAAMFEVFVRTWRPHSAILGSPDGVAGFHDISRYPEARTLPGIVILRWDAPLFFANGNLFRERIRREVRATPPPRWIIVAAAPVTDLDATAADMLRDLDIELNSQDIHLAFAELKDPIKDQLVAFGLLEEINKRHFFPTVEEAVAYCREH
jgi:high affinity sulfate transporter 1